jgi:hypothetical protein
MNMNSRVFLRRVATLVLLPLLAVPSSFGWGHEGHLMINRLAAEGLPADMPAFFHTPEAITEIEYLGPEPDRWRSPGSQSCQPRRRPITLSI